MSWGRGIILNLFYSTENIFGTQHIDRKKCYLQNQMKDGGLPGWENKRREADMVVDYVVDSKGRKKKT